MSITATRAFPIVPLRRAALYLTAIASVWAILNACRVYFMLNGSRVFLLESAVIVFGAISAATILLTGTEHRTDHEPQKTMPVVVGALSSVLFLSLFLNLLTFPFLSDDYVFLGLYRRFSDVLNAPQFFRPLFATVFLLLARAGDGASWPFHLLSVLLHGGSALLVYSLGRQFFGGATAGAVAFTIFLLNPLQLEAVLWISGLQELLWSFFALAALHIYLSAGTLTWKQISWTALMLAAALLSKETAICLALLLPVADLTFFGFRRGPRLLTGYLVFAAVIAAYLVARSQIAAAPDNLTAPTVYFLKQLLSTPYRFFAQPWNEAAAAVPPGIAGVIALLWLALISFVGLRRRPSATILFAPALILVSVLPLQRYFFVAADLTASRYIYFACVGWALLVGGLIAAAGRGRPRLCAAVTAVLAMALTGVLYGNARPWRTVGSLIESISLGVERGTSPEAAITAWQDANGVTLKLRDNVPWDFQGVPIFINGYQEFLALAEERRRASPP